jgi:hypothetical protein
MRARVLVISVKKVCIPLESLVINNYNKKQVKEDASKNVVNSEARGKHNATFYVVHRNSLTGRTAILQLHNFHI